jgi:hypothetical protein
MEKKSECVFPRLKNHSREVFRLRYSLRFWERDVVKITDANLGLPRGERIRADRRTIH